MDKKLPPGINLLLVLVLFLVFPYKILAQQSSIVVGNSFKIKSQILKEERQYLVHLPASYENDKFYIQKRYPVLFLLDGNTHFHLVSGLVGNMSAEENEQIPEMIIVAIVNRDRTRELTPDKVNQNGGSAAFLHFLQDELLPHIEKQYRTLPYRILAGHSLAGLFVIESLLRQTVFNSYLAIDPSLWWDNGALVKTSDSALKAGRPFPTSLFITQANNPFNEGLEADAKGKAIQTFVAALRTYKPEGILYKHVFFSQEDHFSVPLPSFYQGLSFIFEGYKFPLNLLKNSSVSDIRNHYSLFSQRLGTAVLPPGKLLNQVGLFILNQEKLYDKAIEIFSLNQQYYPNTYITYNSLGEAYKRNGDKKLAIYHYKKSLELNEHNENAKKSLLELKE
jgi:predicted alpha/beta superfamily hydrolase